MKETGIQSAICDYLAMRRVFFWRQNNLPRFDKTKGIFCKLPKHTPRGVADIIAVRDGRAIFLEVKTERGKLAVAAIEGRTPVMSTVDHLAPYCPMPSNAIGVLG